MKFNVGDEFIYHSSLLTAIGEEEVAYNNGNSCMQCDIIMNDLELVKDGQYVIAGFEMYDDSDKFFEALHGETFKSIKDAISHFESTVKYDFEVYTIKEYVELGNRGDIDHYEYTITLITIEGSK